MATAVENQLSQQRRELLRHAIPTRIQGTVWAIRGASLVAAGLPVPVGSVCRIKLRGGGTLEAETIGFDGDKTLLAPSEESQGVSPGDLVELVHGCRTIRVGSGLIGMILDAHGKSLDGKSPIGFSIKAPLDSPPISALERPPITDVLATGVRAIDTLLTLGRGQRIGVFAGSGVGKSTLLGMLARGTSADVVVIGLIGERGREVREFLERELQADVRKKCVTVVATSDQPPLKRVQAAKTATVIAEQFRREGKNVLLLMDSVTRLAMAQREIGLAAGEVPTTRGYPPSVFSALPRLVERAGRTNEGSITGIYTVLVEGDDPNEPISDTVRGLLDGHVFLTRKLAAQGRLPAIDILNSLSRLQTQLVKQDQLAASSRLRTLLAAYQDNEDLISIGAYQPGTNPDVDIAIQLKPAIEQFLRQPREQIVPLKNSQNELNQLIANAASLATAANLRTRPATSVPGAPAR